MRDILNTRLPFIGRRKEGSGVNVTVGLTTLGKTKAEQHSLEGPKFDVLDMLDAAGPSTVSEIAQECKMSPNKAKSIVRSLIAAGYARRIRDGEA